MFQEITSSQFTDWFQSSDTYKNNFSYEGLKALYDYLENYEEETGQKVKGIIIALENDTKVKRALSVTSDIDFYQYKINFGHFLQRI